MDLSKEQEYINELSSGSHEAFRHLFMSYYSKVKNFTHYLVKVEVIAEELTQDVFCKIWENRDHLPNLRSFNQYIYRMAKNAALNYLEHKQVEDAYIAGYNLRDEISVEDELDAKEIELLIMLTVQKMPEQRRRIFEMSRVEHLKNDEIAETLHISKRTVEAHLNVALNQIRKAIALSVVFFL